MTTGIFGIPLPDRDAELRAKEQAEEAARHVAPASVPRPRVRCPRCNGRRWELVDHIAKCCATCKGAATVEAPL